MSRIAKIFSLLTFIVMPGFSESWSGVLVDATCFAREMRNRGPTNTEFDVNTDREFDIRQCLPSSKTKLFSLVQRDGQSFELNPAGNIKAAEITRNAGKRHVVRVTATGEKNKNVFNVDSMTLDR